MVTVLAGNNYQSIRSEIHKLISNFKDMYGSLSIEKIDASESDFGVILNAVKSVSMFNSNKLVIVSEVSQNKRAVEGFEALIEAVNSETDLIIVESKLDKRSAYYKTLKKQSGFKELNQLDEASLPNWVSSFVKDRSASIANRDISYLIERVGPNQDLLSMELEKLVQFNPNISRESIDELTVANPQSTIFNLIDMAFSGNPKKALELYDQQRVKKVEPQAIMGMIIWQMHIVALCAAAGDRSPNQVSADSGLNSYVVGKAQTISRGLGMDKIKDFMSLLREIEITSRKQTYNYDDALKYALLKLSYS